MVNSDDEPICAICGCEESAHDPDNGTCTGCGDDHDFEEEE